MTTTVRTKQPWQTSFPGSTHRTWKITLSSTLLLKPHITEKLLQLITFHLEIKTFNKHYKLHQIQIIMHETFGTGRMSIC